MTESQSFTGETPKEQPEDRFMRAALEQARLAEAMDEVPVGAVVVKDDQIFAAGFNRRITDNDPTAHAEVVALRAAAARHGHWNLTGCSLYVTLEPCSMCAGAIVQARISRVVFGAADEKGGVVTLGIDVLDNKQLNHRVEIDRCSSELQLECGKVLTDFFKRKRGQK